MLSCADTCLPAHLWGFLPLLGVLDCEAVLATYCDKRVQTSVHCRAVLCYAYCQLELEH